MADWISSKVPDDIETYVEVFGGAYWVYINSDIYKDVNRVIYNDFNPYMANLFRCASNPKQFVKFIDVKNPPLQTKGIPELSDECRQFFYQCKNGLFATDVAIKKLREILKDKSIVKKERKNLNDILRMARTRRDKDNRWITDKFASLVQGGRKDQNTALKYAYIITSSFSGIDPVDSEFQDYKGKYSCKFGAFYKRLRNEKVGPKLKKITRCENMSFEKVIEEYDSPTTYFYCDPPYWNTESYYSLHGFGRDEHYQLKDMLHKIQGKFSLSYYEFDELREMYSPDKFKWQKKEFVKPAGAKAGIEQGVGEEILIMN